MIFKPALSIYEQEIYRYNGFGNLHKNFPEIFTPPATKNYCEELTIYCIINLEHRRSIRAAYNHRRTRWFCALLRILHCPVGMHHYEMMK